MMQTEKDKKHKYNFSATYLFLKRFFDIFITILGLLVLAPIMVPVVIALLLTAEHYVWYLQDRIGFISQIEDENLRSECIMKLIKT